MTEWIVTSSVLVLVVVALRCLLRGKISLRLQYGLWALVLVRLLVPFTVFQSPISVMNAVEKIDTVELSVTADEIGSDFSDIEYVPSTGVINGYYAGDYDRDFPTVIAPEATEQQFNQLEKAVEAKDVLVPIWLAGVGVMLAVFLISNLRFGGVLRRDRRWLDVPGSIVPVYISAKVETPCLFGFFRPAIYVTEDCAGDESVLRHVLAHESTHYRHGDNIWAVLRCLSLALHWYNPLVWLAAFLSRRDAELACDEGAIKCLGEDERMNYGRTLIGLTCQDVAAKALVLTATTMLGSKKSIRERITLIAKKPRMALYTLIAVLLIAAVAVGCTFTGAEEDISEPDDIVGSEIVGEDGSEADDTTVSSSVESGEVPELDEEPAPVLTPSVRVSTENISRTPYLHLAHSKQWTENGWLMADGVELTPEYIESISHMIPSLSYTPQLSIDCPTAIWTSLEVYDESFQPVHINGEYGYNGLTATRWLAPGNYYCVFGIYGPHGDYIESEGEYEETAYKCIFRLMVIESEFTAQGFESYTGWDISKAYISSESGLTQIRSNSKINEIERILSTARDMGFVGACGYGDAIYLMGNGGTIAICLAGDDCSNFFSDGKCWEIGDVDMEILRDIVTYPTRTGSDFYFTGDAEALVELYAREIYAKELLSVPSGSQYAITDYKLVYSELMAISLDGSKVIGEMRFAVSPEEPEQSYWWAGNTGYGEGEYAGMLTMYRQFELTHIGKGYWDRTNFGTGGAGGWGYIEYGLSAEEIKFNLESALSDESEDYLLRFLPLIDFSSIPQLQHALFFDLVRKAAVGSDQLYRNLYVMKAAQNTDGAFTELFALVLQKQYEYDPAIFAEAMSCLSFEQQQVVSYYLDYVLEYN